MGEARICKICNHLQVNCTGGGLESETQAHDFTPSPALPDDCWQCGEPLDPELEVIYWHEDWCDAGHFCDEHCRDTYLHDARMKQMEEAEDRCAAKI